MMPISSPRSPYSGDLAASTLFSDIMARYTNNWAANVVNQGMDEVLAAIQQMVMPGDNTANAGDVPPPAGSPTYVDAPRDGGGRGGGGQRRDPRFVPGYVAPGNRNPIPPSVKRSSSGWAIPLAAMGLSRDAERIQREARRAARNGENGVYVDPGKERTRERSRTHTSRDGTTTTTTNVNISRNGGTAIARDSGDDGNQQRKRKRDRGY